MNIRIFTVTLKNILFLLLFSTCTATHAKWPYTKIGSCIYTIFLLSALEKPDDHDIKCNKCEEKMKENTFVSYVVLESEKEQLHIKGFDRLITPSYTVEKDFFYTNNLNIHSSTCLSCWTNDNNIDKLENIYFDGKILYTTKQFKDRIAELSKQPTKEKKPTPTKQTNQSAEENNKPTHKKTKNELMDIIIESYFHKGSKLKSGNTICKDEIKQLNILAEEKNIQFLSYTSKPEEKTFYLYFADWDEQYKMCFLVSTADKEAYKIFCSDSIDSYHPIDLTSFKDCYRGSKKFLPRLKTYFNKLWPDT